MRLEKTFFCQTRFFFLLQLIILTCGNFVKFFNLLLVVKDIILSNKLFVSNFYPVLFIKKIFISFALRMLMK
jgi:hypothetical protein